MTRNPVSDGEQLSAAFWSGMVNAFDEESVVSGCTPSKGTGDWDVDVASGRVAVADSTPDVSAQTVTLTTPTNDADLDSGEYRVDLVTVNTSGTALVTEGAAAANPIAPDIPSSEVLIATVLVSGDATSLSSSDIKDYRILHNPLSPVRVLNETSTFTESDVTLTHNKTRVSNGSVHLAEEWYYLNTSYDISTEETGSTGIEWDGTNWWLVGSNTDSVYKYDSTWTYTGTSYDVSTEDGAPQGIAWDGTNWWLVGSVNDNVYKYDSTWTYTGTSYDISTEDGAPHGIEWDGTNWWLVGASNDNVYKYDSTWTYTGTSYSVGSEDGTPTGIEWDGTNWWVVGRANDTVYKYDSTWTYTGTSYDISTEDGTPNGIAEDGSNWWLVGDGTDSVYKYTLSPSTSGDVLVKWGAPTDIQSWDLATFQRTLDTETVTVDVEDSAGTVLFSDIGQNFDISTIAESKNVALRANLSRADTANKPTIDYLARRFIR